MQTDPVPRVILSVGLVACVLAVSLSAAAGDVDETPAVTSGEKDPWVPTIDKVSKAVVAISFSETRAIDTDGPTNSVGTGFVVDKARGLILTNRHMVTVGPVRAKATLLNHEEIILYPFDRDPVHDFGFYRYDPASVKFMKIEELPLHPDGQRDFIVVRIDYLAVEDCHPFASHRLQHLWQQRPEGGLS